MPSRAHPCVFEYVYFARPDSALEGISVHASRLRMGERLAKTFRASGLTAEVGVPVPHSPRTAPAPATVRRTCA